MRLMPVPVMGFVAQPTLEDTNMENIMSQGGTDGLSQMSVGINYTLWRNPDDRSDPVNLAELDESTRRVLDEPAPRPRPAWLIEMAERMRYPMLGEAVRTTWTRDASELSTPSRLLMDHANHILMNAFRDELGLDGMGAEPFVSPLTEKAISEAVVAVDGVEVPALELDTDPLVYAIAAELSSDTVVTAVVPRDERGYIRIEFARRRSAAD